MADMATLEQALINADAAGTPLPRKRLLPKSSGCVVYLPTLPRRPPQCSNLV